MSILPMVRNGPDRGETYLGTGRGFVPLRFSANFLIYNCYFIFLKILGQQIKATQLKEENE